MRPRRVAEAPTQERHKEQGEVMQKLIDNSPISVADLCKQWAEQRKAQLSIHAREFFSVILYHSIHILSPFRGKVSCLPFSP